MELQTCFQGAVGFAGMATNFPESAAGELPCDSRYRSIFGQLDVTIESMRRHPGRDLKGELDGLLQVMRNNFEVENASMGLVGYPDAARHRLQHQSICVNVAVMSHRLVKNQHLLPEELTDLRTLWLEHIEVQDREFVEFLTS